MNSTRAIRGIQLKVMVKCGFQSYCLVKANLTDFMFSQCFFIFPYHFSTNDNPECLIWIKIIVI